MLCHKDDVIPSPAASSLYLGLMVVSVPSACCQLVSAGMQVTRMRHTHSQEPGRAYP